MNEKEREELERLRESDRKTKARQKRQNEAIKEKYYRASVIFPKDTKERIENAGQTVNGLINELVIDWLDRNGF